MKTIYTICFLFLSLAGAVRAQTPSDAIMMKQGELCVALMYEHARFDEYWEGVRLRTNGTIATVKRDVVMPMVAIGIFDKFNLLVGAPYVHTASTEPNGGRFAGARGIQDLSLALKGELINRPLGAGKLAVLAAAGFSTPLTNYLSDYQPYSIGLGTTELSLRGIVQYELNNGLFARGAIAYLHRGQTEAERDFYYNNGAHYSAWMDVPAAWNVHAVAGWWGFDYSLRLEAAYQGLRATSGDDIRAYAAPQPTNRVAFDQLGLSAQYYFKKWKGLGVLAYYARIVNGRNTGKADQFGAGLTYVFRVGNAR